MSKRISTETVQRILDLYAKGAEINYICDVTGVSTKTVQAIRKKYNLLGRKGNSYLKLKKGPYEVAHYEAWNDYGDAGRELRKTNKAIEDILSIIRG